MGQYDCKCGKAGESYVNGEWWCRNCLFGEYFNLEQAVMYTLLHLHEFGDTYPDSLSWLWKWLRDEASLDAVPMEEFISDHLEDYAEWCMTNPETWPVEKIKARARRM